MTRLPLTREAAERTGLAAFDPSPIDRLRAAAANRGVVVRSLGGLTTMSDGSVWMRRPGGAIELIVPPWRYKAEVARTLVERQIKERHRAA